MNKYRMMFSIPMFIIGLGLIIMAFVNDPLVLLLADTIAIIVGSLFLVWILT